ncbi:MAG TPA: GTPase HflX, partial [Nitrospina sp.]|nr:GTPase HflX [Nitrospina sp.]
MQKAILIGVDFPSHGSTPMEIAMEELKGLAETAQYNPIAIISQKLTAVNPKTFIGKGKVEEVAEVVNHNSADIVIFDDNLSPAQNKNLENIFK